MSADLLRRAAAKLREHAEAVPEFFAPPWHRVFTDSESLTGVRSCANHSISGDDLTDEDKLSWACDSCEHIETYSEPLGAYVTMLHPPVALALAAAMEEVAFAVRVNPDTAHRVGYGELIACAREVLREPAEGGA